MGGASKIILLFLWGCVFIFLITITFFYTPADTIEDFVFHDFHDISLLGNDITLQDIGISSELYATSDSSFTISEKENITFIELWKWEYMFDIRKPQTAYQIQSQGFSFVPVGVWKIYVDTRDIQKYKVVSLSNIMALSLLDMISWKYMTELYLYPHMQIVFNPSRNKFLENADLVRIDSVFDISYYEDSFFLGNQENEWENSFLFSMFQYFELQDRKIQSYIPQIQWYHVWSFPWKKYIEKYSSLFVNEEKKKIYYQNIAFENILKIFSSKTQDTTLIQDTYTSIERLRDYPKEYEEIINIYIFLKELVSYSYANDFLFSKINFNTLEAKIASGWNISTDAYKASYILYSLYSWFDYKWEYSYSTLYSFFSLYLKELGIDIENSSVHEVPQKSYLEYFWFFVENIIASRLSNSVKTGNNELSSGNNLQHILQVMSWYISLNNFIYWSEQSNKTLTLIYKYIDVLKSLEGFIFYTYFLPERSENGLLLRNTNDSLTNSIVSLLSDNVNNIFDFYTSWKKFLDSEKQRDIFIENEYSKFLTIFPEYFLALSNYESYVFNYDQSRKDLLDIEIYGQKTDISLSKQNFLQYISQFNFFSLDSLNLEIIDDTYYKVSSIFLQWKEFSFYLYPFSDNKIDNIIVDNEKINSSYKLDSIKINWEEKSRWLSVEEKKKYDFSMFFINTFLAESSAWGGEIYVNDRNIIEEDPVIIVFKRDKLLWNRGEFSPIKKYLEVDYDDIDVVKNNDVYDIYISDAHLWVKFVDKERNTYELSAFFTSQYKLSTQEHTFFNIFLQPYIKKQEKLTPLYNVDIELVWQVDIQNFEKVFLDFVQQKNIIQYVYDILHRDTSYEIQNIQYHISDSMIVFSLIYDNKEVYIEIIWDNIIRIWFTDTEPLETPVSYKLLREKLNNISNISN